MVFELPTELRAADITIETFRKRLKKFLFKAQQNNAFAALFNRKHAFYEYP